MEPAAAYQDFPVTKEPESSLGTRVCYLPPPVYSLYCFQNREGKKSNEEEAIQSALAANYSNGTYAKVYYLSVL